MAFEMTPAGQIIRMVPGPTAEALSTAVFDTADRSLDELLEVAREKFFGRGPDAGQRAIEALWDAFERAKTLEDPTGKKKSSDLLAAKAVRSP